MGKTNMSTGAQIADYTLSEVAGETLNAYNTLYSAGGSSGGSAAAVSLGFAAAALGTDTNSSLRYPSALNGCVTLRPTTGLVSTEGVIILNSQRDVVGPITRTVSDAAYLMDLLTDYQYSYADNLDPDSLAGAKIGVLTTLSYYTADSPASFADIDGEIAALFQNALLELEACGAQIVEVEFPELFDFVSGCWESQSNSAAVKQQYYSALQSLMEQHGVTALVYPTYLHTPALSLQSGWSDSSAYLNNGYYLASPLGIPAVGVPIGSHSTGVGVSMELISLKNSEQLLLNYAYSYTQSFNHRAQTAAVNLYDGGLSLLAPSEYLSQARFLVAGSQGADTSGGSLPAYLWFIPVPVIGAAIIYAISAKRMRKIYNR